MVTSRVPLTALLAIGLLAGCPAPSANKPDTGAAKASPRPGVGSAGNPSPGALTGVPIAGVAIAPAGIVAAGAGNLVGPDGASMVAAGAGNVLSHNGAQFSAGRGLMALSQQPLAGAEVFLAGPDGQPLPDIAPVLTDAQGRFRLVGAPATETVTVQVRVKNQAGTATTLMTLVRPTAAGATANVSIGTTCVAVAVLDGQGGNLGAFNPAKFQVAVETTDKELTPETWPDPADRQAILQAMSRLEAKIDLLQNTLDEIRKELKELRNEVTGGSPAPQATTPGPSGAPSVAPPGGASVGPSTDPSAVAPGTTLTDLALRARLVGPGDENKRVVFVEGDSAGGQTVGDDDGDVGNGVQIHLDQVTFPATFRVYAQADAPDLDPAVVRSEPANLLGVLVVTGLGAGRSTFSPRVGATVAIENGRLTPYFETLGTVQTYAGNLSWEPEDVTQPAPAGPFAIHVESDPSDNWSDKNVYNLDVSLPVGGRLEVAPRVVEIPARFRVDVSWEDPLNGPTTTQSGYVRVYRDYVTDEVRVRFDHDPESPWDFDN